VIGGARRPWYRRVLDVLVATVRHALDDNVPTLAGALTYYALLSLFPALIVIAGILTLAGREATGGVLVDVLAQLVPAEAARALEDPVKRLVADRAGAGTLLGVGLVVALWSASAYVGAFIWAARRVHEVRSGGPFLLNLARRLGFALLILVVLAVLAIVLVASGPVLATLAEALGIGAGALRAYDLARWPLLVGVAVLLISLLYAAAPAASARGVHRLPVGSALAVAIWLVATTAFDYYVARFADYGAVYGALGGVIVFLLWLWIFNIAVLVGAELNAELARRREAAGTDEGEGAEEAEGGVDSEVAGEAGAVATGDGGSAGPPPTTSRSAAGR